MRTSSSHWEEAETRQNIWGRRLDDCTLLTLMSDALKEESPIVAAAAAIAAASIRVC